jgi:raffinose/stachyose/melibiose transport system permease protein
LIPDEVGAVAGTVAATARIWEDVVKSEKTRDQGAAFLYLLPALIFFSVFIVYPFFDGLEISLHRWDGFSQPMFTGLSNYKEMFRLDSLFLKSLGNTSVFAVYTVIGKNVLALFLAVFLSGRIKGRGIYRTILFLPTCLSFVAIGLIWNFIYNPSFGLINLFLSLFGKATTISWLGDPALALGSVAFVDIWKWTGYHMVLYLAGLQMISQDLYEAAAIDGASPMRAFFSITVPQLTPVIIVNAVIALMGAYGVFDIIFVMTRGGPYNSTHTLLTNMYEVTFHQFQLGLGSAIVVVFFAIVMCITIFQNWLSRRLEI